MKGTVVFCLLKGAMYLVDFLYSMYCLTLTGGYDCVSGKFLQNAVQLVSQPFLTTSAVPVRISPASRQVHIEWCSVDMVISP